MGRLILVVWVNAVVVALLAGVGSIALGRLFTLEELLGMYGVSLMTSLFFYLLETPS